MFPAVNGYFLIPNYGTIIAAINFDRSGTTRIGKYVINHSFLVPGLVSTTLAVAIGLLIGSIVPVNQDPPVPRRRLSDGCCCGVDSNVCSAIAG
jgi:hypothetical protein